MAALTKDEMLAGAVEYVAANGIGELSLRRLASAIGTSHRMLIYYFGSRQGLLVEVVRAVERRQRQALVELDSEAETTREEIARRLWSRLADPALWPHERLFFELYAQALQGSPHAAPLLDGIVEDWLGPASEIVERRGVPADIARAEARLGIAVTRGLLLDLLATGDREGVDQAMERFIAISGAAGVQTTEAV